MAINNKHVLIKKAHLLAEIERQLETLEEALHWWYRHRPETINKNTIQIPWVRHGLAFVQNRRKNFATIFRCLKPIR